jgi:hypothetical protein
MTPRYFIGQTLASTVAAHHAQSFKALVDQLVMIPQVLPIRYATYHALKTKAEKGRAKEVPYLTPGCFDESPSPRTTEHVTHCNLICLDLDNGAEPFLRNPDTLARHLAPWNYVAYQTASSTPEAPRMRLIVDAEAIPKDDYAAAVRTIAARIGLAHITKESLIAAQPMYLPSVFKDQGEEHPVFAHRTSGTHFLPRDIEDTDTPTAPGEPRAKAKPASGGDVLEYLRAPVPEATLDVVSAALRHLDPDMSRPQWLEVAAGMRHQFDGEEEEAAYMLFDEWSGGGDKYEGQDDTSSKWRSFRVTPSGRVPVTIRTLFHYAVAGGWDSGKVKADVFARVDGWLREDGRTTTELTSEGLKHIAAAPLLSASEEDMLLQRIVQRSKKLGFTVTVLALRKDLLRLREQTKAKDRPEDPPAPKWAMGWCYCSGQDEFFKHATGEKVKPMAFDRAYSRELLPSEKDLIAQGIPVNQSTLSRPFVLPVQFMTNTLKVLVVHGYEYDPSKPEQLHFEDQGKLYANTYVRTYPELDPSTSAAAGTLFRAHLAQLITEPKYQITLLDFFAYLIQHPGVKIRWAPLIQGVEGCGKTFLSDAMAAVMGHRHVKSIGGQAMLSGWTEWATGYQLVTFEEVRVVGANRFDAMNMMKPLLTNDTINVQQKNKDSREVRNLTNYLALTNHHDSLALSPGDRRYFVLKSRMQSKAQVAALPKGYFQALYDMLATDAGGLRHFLENWKISPEFDANGEAPDTSYRDQLIKDSASEAVATVRQIIAESESCLVQPDLVSSKVLFDLLRGEGLTRLTHQGLGKVLLDDGYTHVGRWLLDDIQHNMWLHNNSLLTVDEARTLAFERAALDKLGVGAHLLL